MESWRMPTVLEKIRTLNCGCRDGIGPEHPSSTKAMLTANRARRCPLFPFRTILALQVDKISQKYATPNWSVPKINCSKRCRFE
jgi:hypothetical protein